MFRRVNNNKFGVIEYAIDIEEDLDKLPREDTNNTVYAILRKGGKKLVYLYSKELKDYILINGDLEEINAELENINEQLDNMKSYIYTSKMNLDIEDKNNTNFDILCGYVDKGFNIFVDNNYKINVKKPYVLKHDLKICGQTNCGFNFNVIATDTTEVFTINGDVRIELNNVKISGLTQYLFNAQPLKNKISFEMKNCYLSGNIVALYVRSAVDDTNQNHKMVSCVIENNILENITPSGIGIDLSRDGENYGIFNIINSMYDNVIFRNNYIHNFKRTVLYCNMVINSENIDEEISLNRKVVIIDGNNVINDLNHFDDTKNVVMYHTLCLVKGYRCIYTNNKVEGLKSAAGRPVYDIYSSTTHLLSTGNYVKNNVQLGLSSTNDNELFNCLVKSKGNRVTNENGTRIIKNNTFIIQKEYVQTLGYSVEFAYTKFLQITTDNPLDYCIENNVVEGYIVDFGQSTIPFDYYIFNNNNIKADYIMGYIVTVAQNTKFKNCEESTITICNNRFNANQSSLPTFETVTNNEMSCGIINHRYSSVDLQPTLKEIKLIGNVFNMCFVNRMLAPIERVDVHTLIFNDNVINNSNVGNTDSLIFSGTVIDKVIFKNNIIDGYRSVGVPVGRLPRNTYIKNKFTVNQFSATRAGNVMHDYNSGLATKKCRGYINIKLVDDESPAYEVKFDFVVDNNLITFYENGETKTLTLTGNSGTLYYPSRKEKINLRFLDRDASTNNSAILYIYNGDDYTNLKGTLEVEYILKEI